MRGGESVLEAILDVVPQAEIFSLFHFAGSVSRRIESHVIHTSPLQPLATRISDYRKLLPLYPFAARHWDFRGFDVIVSSSHCVAKGVNARGLPHLCYCHTPMRYVWDRFDDYFPRSKPFTRALVTPVAAYLRRWDRRTSGEVTEFLANSQFVQSRIAQFYGRESTVVHPFVDRDFLDEPLADEREDYHLIVSALVPYKRVELAVEAAAATGKPLVVIGGGPLLSRMSAAAPPNVRFLGHVPRAEIVERLMRARSLILPGIEDFGITPLEAMALGTPVVALRGGGVVDSVVEGENGIFFDSATVDSVARAMAQVEAREWDRATLRARAARFSREHFTQKFAVALGRVLDRHDPGQAIEER
jgi:glycosyltransferase involved in cell wall biosynthesis